MSVADWVYEKAGRLVYYIELEHSVVRLKRHIEQLEKDLAHAEQQQGAVRSGAALTEEEAREFATLKRRMRELCDLPTHASTLDENVFYMRRAFEVASASIPEARRLDALHHFEMMVKRLFGK